MKDYKLEIGNSTRGKIGLVSYCKAKNKRDALAVFNEQIGDVIEVESGRYYTNVYLGDFALRDIREA